MPRRTVVGMWVAFYLIPLAFPGQALGQPAPQRQPVYLRVLLPMADTQLKVENTSTRQSGINRLFISPPLEAGKSYVYTLTGTWEPNNYTTITRSREVTVRAGQEVEVDLRKADEKHPDKIVIRYVPTPDEVVEGMLKLGEVGKDDVVYDLGCGDGRIVITAVEKFGARRGVGMDIDPERIKDSRANARQHKVEDRVEFRQGDVLEIRDFSAASVVMLYMGDDLNLQLRPILQKTLKPGSRIVSHRFTMGDWKPLKTVTVIGHDGEQYKLHLWKIGERDAKK